MEYAIAVVDIGMTNKKVAVYDDSLRQLDARYQNFKPLIVDGLEVHDLDGMEEWFIAQLKELALKFPIKALAVSAHGATFVCVDKDGKPAIPCVYYTHEPGEDFHAEFYSTFGDPLELQARTGTPYFKSMINPAKGLYFSKRHFSEGFKNTAAILPYPQYWGFRFTGKMGIEGTYMGNHTYLWDHVENCFSSVAEKMGIASLLPKEMNKPWDVLSAVSSDFAGKTGLPSETIVTLGIHDSNSALLPHFAKKGERRFILNSTGTWCVVMNPVDKYGFAKDELGKVVFYNISAFGTPIKTAIFLGGLEFETWSSLIMKKHGRTDIPGWDENLYRSILLEKKIFLLPELTPGSGQFPFSKARVVEDGKNYLYDSADFSPPCFDDYEKAFAVLRISLVMQSITALERTGIKDDFDVFTEGGFRRDESYSVLLASAFPNNRKYLTDIEEASALGAAMTAKMALSGKSLNDLSGDFNIIYQEQEKKIFPEMEAYRKTWLTEAEKELS